MTFEELYYTNLASIGWFHVIDKVGDLTYDGIICPSDDDLMPNFLLTLANKSATLRNGLQIDPASEVEVIQNQAALHIKTSDVNSNAVELYIYALAYPKG